MEALVGSNIISIASGAAHALALSSNGELYAWGSNQHGQLGLGDAAGPHSQTPILAKLPSNCGRPVGLACGGSHTVVWTESGAIVGAGNNKYGQLGLMSPRVQSFDLLMEEIAPVSCRVLQAACGSNHTLVLTLDGISGENRLFASGSNNFGQVKGGSTASLFRSFIEATDLRTVWGITRVLFIAAGGDQSFLGAVPEGVTSLSAVMRKQFSTLASHSLHPLSTTEVLDILSDAISGPRALATAVASVTELFASSSLLAASFLPQSNNSSSQLDYNSSAIDAVGLEALYVAILQLPNPNLVTTKLLTALRTSTLDLEKLLEASSNSNAPMPESTVRTLLILWLCPLNSNAVLSAELFPRLVRLIGRLSLPLKTKLTVLLNQLPQHLLATRVLRPAQEHLSLIVDQATDGQVDPSLPLYCLVLNLLYSLNRNSATPLSLDIFYNPSISALPDEILAQDFLGWKQYQFSISRNPPPSSSVGQSAPFFFSNHPYLLSADAKRRILQTESRLQQQHAQQQAVTAAMFSTPHSPDGVVYVQPYFLLVVDREKLLTTALSHVAAAADSDLKKPLKVVFAGEEGIDEGGVKKEFFQLMVREGSLTNHSLFRS